MSDNVANRPFSDDPYTGQPLKRGSSAQGEKKDSILRDIAILVAITLVAGFLLGAAYTITKEPIAAAQAQTKAQAQRAVMREGAAFETIYPAQDKEETGESALPGFTEKLAQAMDAAGLTATEVTQIDEAFDESGESTGYVVTVTNSEGYGGDVELMCGIVPQDGENVLIEGIYFLSLSETAGMGMKAKDEEFMGQFTDKIIGSGELVSYTKNGASASNEIDAISGCTVTTSAVTKDVNAAITAVRTVMSVRG